MERPHFSETGPGEDLRSFFPLEFYERHRPDALQYFQRYASGEGFDPAPKAEYDAFPPYRAARTDHFKNETIDTIETMGPDDGYSCDSFEPKRGYDCGQFKIDSSVFADESIRPPQFKAEDKASEFGSAPFRPDDIKVERGAACWKCNYDFAGERELEEHFKVCPSEPTPNRTADESADKTENEGRGKYACETCLLVCQSPAILKIHERVHSGEKPFACSFCDYKSGQKNNVAKHLLVHMKKKPYSCQYCDYRCAQKNNLIVHERTHTGFKPFACTFCEYKTVQKPNLVKHMYLHTNEKPFACDVCDYRCVQKTNLMKHKQKHTMEKPFACVECDYKCSQKSNLQKHLLIHKKYDSANSAAEVYGCQCCPFKCSNRDVLNKHIAEKHNMLKQEFIDNVNMIFENSNVKPYVKQYI